MPKGGHAASGPPPDPNALKRNRPSDAAGWTTLPAEGRAGEAPEWPLLFQTQREYDLWATLWAKPQAVMWEHNQQAFEVAMFVRKLAHAEQPDASVELQKVIRQYLESLGLTTQGMARNRWKIAATDVEDEVEQPEPDKAKPAARRKSARDRLKVVSDGDGN